MIVLALLIIAGVSNALMDTIAHKGGGVLPKSKWWTMEDSWRNKWKNGDPEQGEKFFLSSTVLVFTTDAWHFFQSIMLTCFCAAITLGRSDFNFLLSIYDVLVFIIHLIIYKVVFSVSFEITWRALNK